MLENIKRIDRKMLMMLGVLGAVILIIVVAIIVVSLTSGGKLSYSKIENKMVEAAEKYYRDNANSLPSAVGDEVEIDVSTLASGGYMRNLSEYNNSSCSGKVLVGKVSNGYDYVASLDCGEDYKTRFLVDKLLENVATSGNGLYKMEDVVRKQTNSIDNDLMSGYIYRGEVVNNFVKMDKVLYRVVKIDGNNDLMMFATNLIENNVYDDRYNSSIQDNYGYNDYKVSRAYENLQRAYEEKPSTDLIKTKAVGKDICVGKRSDTDTATDGSLECSDVLENQYYSLLPMYDYMNASLDKGCTTALSQECNNYNYLSQYHTWMMTGATSSSYEAYKLGTSLQKSRTYTNGGIRFVNYLSKRLVYVSGSGTELDPYIVK